MNMKKLSSSFQAVMDIARHAGAGMTVTQEAAIPWPVGSCRVWEFTPTLPPLDRPPVVVVFLQDRSIRSWQAVSLPYPQAIDHYQAIGRTHAPPPSPPAPLPRAIAWPPLPSGVRVTLPALAGGPVFRSAP